MTYVLDTNIIIRVWDECPDVLTGIEAAPDMDFLVTTGALQELSDGEPGHFFPKMSPKFQRLIKHLVNTNEFAGGKKYKENRFPVLDGDDVRVVIANKVSSVDHGEINVCQNNADSKLVTEDGKIQKSARLVLGESRVLAYDDFISELVTNGIRASEKAQPPAGPLP